MLAASRSLQNRLFKFHFSNFFLCVCLESVFYRFFAFPTFEKLIRDETVWTLDVPNIKLVFLLSVRQAIDPFKPPPPPTPSSPRRKKIQRTYIPLFTANRVGKFINSRVLWVIYASAPGNFSKKCIILLYIYRPSSRFTTSKS